MHRSPRPADQPEFVGEINPRADSQLVGDGAQTLLGS